MNEEFNNPNQSNKEQTIIINQKKQPTNGIGTAGFVLAIIALLVGCVPILGWIVWFCGLLFSFIGVFNKPKGLAIAGLIISLIGIILLLVVFSSLAMLGLGAAATGAGIETP